ncbi:unnamed protein product [Rhizoctonia solani]|uniref:Fungal zn(2)-cys(6) binuclear cluster domain protein n=1 Tax=Rhizoctonia solani TaxID=456999 RepID=A0A8H2WD58_9AGAM|nr:unnamed protein product [Rhizoctonia solani]
MVSQDQSAYIINKYQIARCRLWFMTPPTAIRQRIVAQLTNSKTMIWALYLGAQIFQALIRDPYNEVVQTYIGWIDTLENKFAVESHRNPPLTEISDRILAQLELAYLKFTTVDIVSGYVTLRRALPGFLRLAAADKSLYMEHPNGNLVLSFPRALNSPRHELERFIIYDTATAFVLGVPPLVEYGYSNDFDCVSPGFEWIHGIPAALVEAISQINSWRAGSRAPPLDDWRILERHILAWQPQIRIPEHEESVTECVARLAVQESWRYVVLIYLYMGMCQVSSHDSRVQASIRQIIRLGETVTNLPIGIHMFTHCVMAGVAARLEKHRTLVRERLLSFKDTRVWLFRGPQFSQVLEHLWLGVGAGGGPVTWDDYVRSRCAVIPL